MIRKGATACALSICVLLAGCGAGSPTATTVAISATAFDFGPNIVGNTLSHTVVQVNNSGTVTLHLNPVLTGDPGFTLIGAQSCGRTLPAAASCSVTVNYTPVAASGANPQTAVLNLQLSNALGSGPQTVMLTGTAAVLSQGVITPTHNPQVALYTMNLPYPGSVTVNFGSTSDYGQQTWNQPSPTTGGQVSIFVAGMVASSTYHMQAVVKFANGLSVTDVDHTFNTGVPPAGTVPNLTATATPGMTPQPGLEMMNPLGAGASGVAISDLSGNVLWGYPVPAGAPVIDGLKQLPNSDFLMVLGTESFSSLDPGAPNGALVSIREVNLGGDTVRELTLTMLNSELAAAGYPLTLLDLHHDVTVLPNGHWLVLANALREYSNLTGFNGPTQVLGDVLIDVDVNLQPVWLWSAFDHLDVNRHPYQFPDWTHANTIVYSKDDGNILLSIRHQNWVIKIDYENGQGDGNILWKLGEGGDFALQGGTDPVDWFYAQHYPSFFSVNTTGRFSLGLMDNGDDRILPAGADCDTEDAPPCYSSVPILQIDEAGKTASLQFHQILPTSLYNYFGGSMQQLANGNIEYDLCGVNADSDVFEVTDGSSSQGSPQTVWHLHSSGTNLYRALRIPSLYPGVQW